MRRIHYVGYCLLAILYTSCGPPQSLTDAEIETLKTEVLQATMARNAAYVAADADLAFSFFSRAPGALEANGGYYKSITAEMLEDMRGLYGGLENGNIDIGTPQIEILGPESAMVFIDGNWSFTVKESGEEMGSPFVMTLIWVKEDGAWKVFHKHESVPASRD